MVALSCIYADMSAWMQDHHLQLKLGKTDLQVFEANQSIHRYVDIDQLVSGLCRVALFNATRLLAQAIASDSPEGGGLHPTQVEVT